MGEAHGIYNLLFMIKSLWEVYTVLKVLCETYVVGTWPIELFFFTDAALLLSHITGKKFSTYPPPPSPLPLSP